MKPMESLADLPKISPLDLGIPNKTLRNLKLLNNEPMITERVSLVEKKQLLYILEDCSGSMLADQLAICAGLMLSFLREVQRGNTILYHRFFDNAPKNLLTISLEKPIKFADYRTLQERYNGGGTCIHRAIDTAISDIVLWKKENPEMYMPEVAVVTDGEDHINEVRIIEELTKENIKLHYIHVGGDCCNGDLRKVVESINCKYIKFE